MKKLRAQPLQPDINVTPLVDVVLVLLIIFMVVAPQMDSGADVTPPVAAHPDAAKMDQEPTVLLLTRDGHTWFDKQPIEGAALEAQLKKFHGEKPDMKLVVKADRAAPYGSVRKLFKLCQSLGFPGVSLQVVDKAGS